MTIKKQYTDPDLYDRESWEKPHDSVLTFFNTWENTILSNYELDTLMFSISYCTLMTFEEFVYYIENHEVIDYSWLDGYDDIIRSAPGGGGGLNDCTCRYDVYCSMFLNNECEQGKNGCRVIWDCGVAGSSESDGQCEENIVPDSV